MPQLHFFDSSIWISWKWKGPCHSCVIHFVNLTVTRETGFTKISARDAGSKKPIYVLELLALTAISLFWRMYFEVKKKTGFGKVMKKSAGCGIRKSPSRPLRDRKKNRGQASRLRQMTNELHLGTWCNHAIGRGGVAWRHKTTARETTRDIECNNTWFTACIYVRTARFLPCL